MWDIPFSIHTPAGMTGIWTLKLLSALFEKWNLKSLFFIGMFEKNLPSLVGGGGGGDKNGTSLQWPFIL